MELILRMSDIKNFFGSFRELIDVSMYHPQKKLYYISVKHEELNIVMHYSIPYEDNYVKFYISETETADTFIDALKPFNVKFLDDDGNRMPFKKAGEYIFKISNEEIDFLGYDVEDFAKKGGFRAVANYYKDDTDHQYLYEVLGIYREYGVTIDEFIKDFQD